MASQPETTSVGAARRALGSSSLGPLRQEVGS
jgi:hypothetical protein